MNEQITAPELHLLVIDDEPLVLQLLTAFLTNDGHSVVTAVNGRQGLEKFNSECFDLVLTDYHMPGMDGLQLVERIRQDPSNAGIKANEAAIGDAGVMTPPPHSP